jgi:hypothetical protein
MAAPTPTGKSIWNTFVELILIPIDKGVLAVVPEVGHLSPIIL